MTAETPASTFRIPAAMAAEIVAHAQAGYPEEVCGIIAGRDAEAMTLYRGRNVSSTPQVTYELDIDTLALQIGFEAEGFQLVGIYHSHPHGPDIPSVTDIAQAYYPDAVYIICSMIDPTRPSLRGFRIGSRDAIEVRLAGHDRRMGEPR
jgi:proteasome lid subunit RPN8/RPN11